MFSAFAHRKPRQIVHFALIPVVLNFLLAESTLADVTIAPNSPAVGFYAPFGFGSTVEPGNPGNTSLTRPWAPYAVYVYRDVPAFSAAINDIFAFDLGAPNDVGIFVEIALAHGPDAPADNIFERNLEPFTVIASNLTGGQVGNSIVGDYELAYAMNEAFEFDGGTLLIRVSMPSVSYQADDTCTANAVWGGIGDSSGYFYRRIIRATNPVYPYGTTVFSDTSGIPAFRVITGNSTDMSVSLTGTTQALLGESLQYEADYFNASQVDSTQTELVIDLPPNISFDSATPAGANCQDVSAPGGTTITCALGLVSSGNGGTVTIDATASPINSGTGDVDATIDSAEPDENEADNSASLRVAIDEFEFEIEDSRFDHFDRAIPFTATIAGEMQTHSIIYRNLSTVDQGITFTSPPSAPFTLRDPNSCETQTIANECEFFIDFTPQVVGNFADNVVFNAYPIASTALASVDVELSGRGVNSIADLAMNKTANINSVTPGASGSDLVTWRLEVTNNGPATADVVVTDVLPNGVTVIPGMKPSAYDDTTGIWDVGSVAEGGVRILNIPTTVAPGVPDCLENTATAGFAAGQTVSDDIDANDAASASIGTPGCVDLVVTTRLSDDVDEVVQGDVTATLAIDVTNAGPTDATNVELSATDAGAGALSFSPSCTGGMLGCSYTAPDLALGNIAAGETVTTSLIVYLAEGNDVDVTYDYTVTANETDPNLLNNRANGGFPIIATPDSIFGGSKTHLCFVATAAYGSYMEPEVQLLREFRDRYLLTHAPGRAFVDWYYATSPPYADLIAANDQLRWVARLLLTPMVYSIKYPVPAFFLLLTVAALATRRRRSKLAKQHFGLMRESFEAFEYRGWRDARVCRSYDEHFGAVTVQSVEPMLDAANVQKSREVLDVCTGAGYAAGAAAKRGAIAIGIDFSQVQIDIAKAKYPNAAFQTGDATSLDFGSDRFDAVVNGIGMPHFEDPDEAIREAFRVLKPGGKFAFTVYDKPQNSVGFGVIYSAVQLHGSLDIGLPVGPSFFLLSDPAEGAKRLEDAGFESVLVATVPQTLYLAAPEELYEAVQSGSVRAAATLQGQSSAAIRMIQAHIKDVVSQYRDGERYEVPMPAVLFSASKPNSD